MEGGSGTTNKLWLKDVKIEGFSQIIDLKY